jgi:hypothetical protein
MGDPKNRADVLRALDRLARHGKVNASPNVAKNLTDLEIRLPAFLQITTHASADDILIAGFFIPGEEPYFADNVIGECDSCRRPVQYRPNVTFRSKFCLFCAAEHDGRP